MCTYTPERRWGPPSCLLFAVLLLLPAFSISARAAERASIDISTVSAKDDSSIAAVYRNESIPDHYSYMSLLQEFQAMQEGEVDTDSPPITQILSGLNVNPVLDAEGGVRLYTKEHPEYIGIDSAKRVLVLINREIEVLDQEITEIPKARFCSENKPLPIGEDAARASDDAERDLTLAYQRSVSRLAEDLEDEKLRRRFFDWLDSMKDGMTVIERNTKENWMRSAEGLSRLEQYIREMCEADTGDTR